jgi:signal transduction histidine kinase
MGNLLRRSDLSGMGQAAKKKVAESIYEIFENARLHSESEYIYTCGQFFPAKHSLLFTISDTGVGFKNRVSKRFNKELPSTKAIQWAMGEGNSTKLDIPGGIGLAILKDFTSQNGGKIQIVSGDGFYESSSQGSKTRSFDGAFPGTIVNVEFKTNDQSSYSFFTDIDDDLF